MHCKDTILRTQNNWPYSKLIPNSGYKLAVSVDGILFHTFDISSVSGREEYFHDNCYVLFNLAVGGDFPNILEKDQITALPEGAKAHMYVDWIRIY